MKRVSFEVAKYLKEVGYPQDKYECNEGYAISEVRYQEYDSFDESWYWYTAHPGTDLIFGTNYFYPENCGEYCVAPYYLAVWLWLWREKKIIVMVSKCTCFISIDDGLISGIPNKDPEESFASAIDYLVKNKIIK